MILRSNIFQSFYCLQFSASLKVCKHGKRTCNSVLFCITFQDSSVIYFSISEFFSCCPSTGPTQSMHVLPSTRMCTFSVCVSHVTCEVLVQLDIPQCISPCHWHQKKWWKVHTSTYVCPGMYSKSSQVLKNGFRVSFLQLSVQQCATGRHQDVGVCLLPRDHRKRLQHSP